MTNKDAYALYAVAVATAVVGALALDASVQTFAHLTVEAVIALTMLLMTRGVRDHRNSRDRDQQSIFRA